METEEIRILALNNLKGGALVAMFILKGGVWAVKESSGEVGDNEVPGGAVVPIVFGEALFDDRHAHDGGGDAFDEWGGYNGKGGLPVETESCR